MYFWVVSQVSKVISYLFNVTYCQTVGHINNLEGIDAFQFFIHIMMRKFNVKQSHQAQNKTYHYEWVTHFTYRAFQNIIQDCI